MSQYSVCPLLKIQSVFYITLHSLHDPHCRKLFLNNKKLRSHLMDLGLVSLLLQVLI